MLMKKDFRFREIPYNYTSFSDREIILKFFGEETADLVETLRNQRVTGRSAKLLAEVIGEIFIIDRNPYLFQDYLDNKSKLQKLQKLHDDRLQTILQAANDNALVHELIRRTKELDKEFFHSFAAEKRLQIKISFGLLGVTAKENIHFGAFHKVSHSTDATDWRVEYPAVVVYPDSAEEIAGLVKAAKRLKLSIIPRGGGTGLTGGAIPVNKRTMVMNMEKLRCIGDIEHVHENGITFPTIGMEAGVVTDDVIEHCESHGYIFATDPTSAWASTIGGNIAENAGGKKCVMWGTAIDNLYSFQIVNAAGQTLEVKRRNHQHRKILPDDTIIFDVTRKESGNSVTLRTIELTGTDIRKKGLGKDITNKALKGLPGVQKEGGDGIIVSARFVLYKPFQHCKTLCLEFFGTNLINASRAIVEINEIFEKDKHVFLTALEHFDEKYVVALNYRNKSKRTEIPKAVLLIDAESNDEQKLIAACAKVVKRIKVYNAEAMVASNEAERVVFWKDRKNLGAIAKHTNAFKLNEDVVIPLDKLPEFADFIEKLNLTKELENNIAILQAVDTLLGDECRSHPDDIVAARIESIAKELHVAQKLYTSIVTHLDVPAATLLKKKVPVRCKSSVFHAIRDGEASVAFDADVLQRFRLVFHGYDDILKKFEAAVAKERKRKVIIATHMHAGDGNVHVNIPVLSNDYLMMREADESAAASMNEAVRLGGVVSGEHGIGLTKLRFIDKEILDAYQEYKKENDPDDLFNPGKLSATFPLERVYTPSFNLLELEAFILEATDLESLSTSIASCVRCGKCKSVCNTHYPKGTMFFNPRNKILGVGLITEAVLFEAQTMNTVSFRHLTKLREISSHCTMCHKCETPCPVKIDFGDVTLNIRNLLVRRKKQKSKLITRLTLFYLRRRGYYVNKFFRYGLLKIGYGAQRIGYFINKPVSTLTAELLPAVNDMLKGKLPPGGKKSLREELKLTGSTNFFCFENPKKPVTKSVVYFPGCGSERMFPEISMATIALLYEAGVRVVIPPEFLCCGYPLLANGRIDQANMKSYENRVLLHRIADATGYMDIRDIVVSCGTCYEMLERYELENIFNGARLIDVNEFLVKEKIYHALPPSKGQLLYHEPCHTPMKALGAQRTIESLFSQSPVTVPFCCGEGGTLALSTPAISNTLRERKADAIEEATSHSKVTVLTTCPSCVQGLSRISNGVTVKGKSLIVYAAEQYLGKQWEKKFLSAIKNNGVEKMLF
jgi:FAD/FMN-containing dehydrogenase/Fe-S oxidoreductase